MIIELDKVIEKYEAEEAGSMVWEITQSYWSVKHFLEEATESGRSWALSEALSWLLDNYTSQEVREIADAIFMVFLY